MAEPSAASKDKEALETAWKIHAALVDWTGKVDAKASFAFTLESAGLATMVALSAKDRLFGTLTGPLQNITYHAAVFSLLVAAACAMWVVIPRLRMRHVGKEWPDNFIYFGHLKYWDASKLPQKIQSTEMLPVITKQMIGMSKIAWMKHLFVKASMILASIGGVCLLTCGLLVRAGLSP
ncbi:hypothetical protein ASG86_03690 [Arthrobacter sp. Soil764]|nr:hypothetical protein ASG86_03690 [Arthrobacter sp. Soil764]